MLPHTRFTRVDYRSPEPLDKLDRFFAKDGVLSQAVERYEVRPGQRQMAAEVASVLERGGVRMIEAATGTGKTLAYLLPLVLSGKRAIISTGTLNLQDQIDQKDLPFLRDRLGLDVQWTVLKGRDNYLCRYRLAEFARQPLLKDAAEVGYVERVIDWAAETETGDRAELSELPERLQFWREINARADTCSGSRCPEYDACWLTRVKREAQQARIVVVNHHLFFADLAVRSEFGAVLPEYDTVIFDEAHLLEEVATLYFGIQVSTAQIEELARDAEKLSAANGGPRVNGAGAGPLRESARDFFMPLQDLLRDAVGRIQFVSATAGGPDLEAEWAVLSNALDEVARQSTDLEKGAEVVESLARRCETIRLAMQQIIGRDDAGTVYGLELRGRSAVILTASPIDVAATLRERLFDRVDATVLTSATLAVGGVFDFYRQRLGLDDAEGSIVPSSFDYAKQAALYLPQHMPEPRDPGYLDRALDEIVGLLEVSRGRAFLLFTSYAQMHRVHERLVEYERWPLFLQGEGSKVGLIESFRTTDRAVLLGTTSFWQGVDVAGSALSLVVIDKLPFDVPSDPLVAARIERLRQQGRNPFMEYQLPMAVLDLKQGLGRLLRGREDRGILAVLDARLVSKRYGRVFLDSLPPYSRFRDREPLLKFIN